MWVVKLLAGIIKEHNLQGELCISFCRSAYSYYDRGRNSNNTRSPSSLPSPFNHQQALRVLETRLKKMAGNDAKASSLKVGGKDQEIDLEASTTAKV